MDIYNCPWCDTILIILKKDQNCKIFRHGVYKNNFKQINPHASEEECKLLIEQDLIYGCGKPFKLNRNKLEKCDYI